MRLVRIGESISNIPSVRRREDRGPEKKRALGKRRYCRYILRNTQLLLIVASSVERAWKNVLNRLFHVPETIIAVLMNPDVPAVGFVKKYVRHRQ